MGASLFWLASLSALGAAVYLVCLYLFSSGKDLRDFIDLLRGNIPSATNAPIITEHPGRGGEVIIALGTSGKFVNILEACGAVRRTGILVIAFVGRSRYYPLARVGDIVLIVEGKDTPRIQEAHMVAGHVMCEIVGRIACLQ
jgi:fructoselysine-6-P-deglycase FrlB-like protein